MAEPEEQVTAEVLRLWKRDCPDCVFQWLAGKAAPNLSARERKALAEIMMDNQETTSKETENARRWPFPFLRRFLGQ